LHNEVSCFETKTGHANQGIEKSPQSRGGGDTAKDMDEQTVERADFRRFSDVDVFNEPVEKKIR
jgi:hypothetical protein